MREMTSKQEARFSGRVFQAPAQHQESREERKERVEALHKRDRDNLKALRDDLSPTYFDDNEDFHEPAR